MASTYENVLWDRVVNGIETILEAEFGSSAIVYKAEEAKKQTRNAIRIWPEDPAMELLGKNAGMQFYEYFVGLTVSLRHGQTVNNTVDARLEVATRAMRVLNDNCSYTVSGSQQWYEALTDSLAKIEDSDDWHFIYTVKVGEAV